MSLPDQPNTSSITTTLRGILKTIVETSKNATGQRIKQIVYTFGMDEISQTVRTYDAQTQSVTSTLQHYFGHDGHGSFHSVTIFSVCDPVLKNHTQKLY
ncbi:MAG: hypothetical protein U0905_15875 [Pirellulales bacterium]